jgi:hypothetical protein
MTKQSEIDNARSEVEERLHDDWDKNVADTDNDSNGDNHVKYEISCYPSDMPLAEYRRKKENDGLIIPNFQRKYVWSKRDASKLVESFLLGLPVPGVFLYKRRSDNKFLVVDGQQRILSALYFMNGMFKDKAFRLENVRSKWDGKTFEELDESDRRHLEDSILRATIIQQLDPEDDTSIYHVFERLNTGGKNLNPMEVRRCVYASPFAGKLEELNTLPEWRKLIGNDKEDVRYRDVEWILRSLAFSCRREKYEKPMKLFLTEFMKDNGRNCAESQSAIERFPGVCKLLLSSVGEKPFHLKGRLNYAALDSVLGTLLSVDVGAIPSNLKERFDALLIHPDFEKGVTLNTSDVASVVLRFDVARKIFLD